MTYIRETIDDLENQLQDLFDKETSPDEYSNLKAFIYKELDKYEEEYWSLRDQRDKYIAWGN
jgi:hypothetical protein